MTLLSGISNSGIAASAGSRNARAVGLWLLVIAGLVFALVVVGGATRLTQSGLSMVDWRPITGVVPPLTGEQWAEEFDAYRQYPEYKLVNRGMSLDEFKAIFWWEYAHRLLGRLVGIAFAVPLIVFLVRGMVPPGLAPRLVGLFLLGGAQGLLGWYMVQSGLVSEPDVSQYRLTAHLTLALIIFAALIWTALDLLRHARPGAGAGLRRFAYATVGLIFLQIMMGGLVAGLDAGRAYNTWPLMAGALVPPGLFEITPWWLNLFESTLTVQFNHRVGAYVLTFASIGAVVWSVRTHAGASTQRAALMLLVAIVLQMLIGVFTLVYEVPVSLGVLHQAMGALVLAAGVNFAHRARGRR